MTNHDRGWTRPSVVEYIFPPDTDVVSLSGSPTGPLAVQLEVTEELVRAHTYAADNVSAIDLVDNPAEQVKRLGRVMFRRVQ